MQLQHEVFTILDEYAMRHLHTCIGLKQLQRRLPVPGEEHGVYKLEGNGRAPW
jgi:hypothetical protein